MLPSINLGPPNSPLLWQRSSLVKYLFGKETGAINKQLERLISESSYIPPNIQPKSVLSEDKYYLQQNLLQHDIDIIRSRRGKWLVLQYWSIDDYPPLIMANDGRGKRYWLFSENEQSIGDHLTTFVKSLEAMTASPILLILHDKLSIFRKTFKDNDLIIFSRTPYQIKEKIVFSNSLKINTTSASLSHLDYLEAESIYIIREVIAETKNPTMLYSIGKDSAVMLHLARKAFWPGTPPFPLLHVDTGWKFRAMYDFRDQVTRATGMELLVHKNSDGVAKGINPINHGSAIHTDIMKTQGLKQALDIHKFDAAFGGARRDEEKSRAKERIFSFRTRTHQWDPKNQRPELWNLYNTRVSEGETMRIFPLSNWTELDIWSYIYREDIPIVPLYFAAERPTIERDGALIMVDDERLTLTKSDKPRMRQVRFRTLGCYPLTGAFESSATTLEDIILELLVARQSERQGRTIDKDSAASMEQKKMEGYF